MAGRGAAPKFQEDRAGTQTPSRGEWQDCPPLRARVLPPLPRRGQGEGSWSVRAKRMWEAWSKDPVTAFFGPSEIAQAVELAFLFEELVREPTPPKSAEVRQWSDRLGLNPKGKRDLRFRLVPAAKEEQATRSSAVASRYGDLKVLPGGGSPAAT